MISPLQYEARYKTLQVEFIATDTPPVSLSITKYRLGKMTPGRISICLGVSRTHHSCCHAMSGH